MTVLILLLPYRLWHKFPIAVLQFDLLQSLASSCAACHSCVLVAGSCISPILLLLENLLPSSSFFFFAALIICVSTLMWCTHTSFLGYARDGNTFWFKTPREHCQKHFPFDVQQCDRPELLQCTLFSPIATKQLCASIRLAVIHPFLHPLLLWFNYQSFLLK